MRRLAKQSRDDTYASQRDYQTVEFLRPVAVTITWRVNREGLSGRLRVTQVLKEPSESSYIGFGGFLFPETDCDLSVTLTADGDSATTVGGMGE